MTWDRLIDVGIIMFGGSAIWLVARPDTEPRRRWGYICGLCSQPFWFAMAIKNGLWGTLAISCWYAVGWTQGVWFHYLKGRKIATQSQ